MMLSCPLRRGSFCAFLFPVARHVGDQLSLFVAQHQEAALGARQAHDGVHHDAQDFVEFERGVDHLSDLRQRHQLAVLRLGGGDQFDQAVEAGLNIRQSLQRAGWEFVARGLQRAAGLGDDLAQGGQLFSEGGGFGFVEGHDRCFGNSKIRLSGNCRGSCASSCTAGGRQCNCRQNWWYITPIPMSQRLSAVDYAINDGRNL
jgi:hypothetical protein